MDLMPPPTPPWSRIAELVRDQCDLEDELILTASEASEQFPRTMLKFNSLWEVWVTLAQLTWRHPNGGVESPLVQQVELVFWPADDDWEVLSVATISGQPNPV